MAKNMLMEIGEEQKSSDASVLDQTEEYTCDYVDWLSFSKRKNEVR